MSLKKSIFGPTWPQHGPILVPKMAPSWLQNGVKTGPKTVSEARSAPEPILGRFWADFGSMLGRFWDDVGTILGGFLVDFGMILVDVSHRVFIALRLRLLGIPTTLGMVVLSHCWSFCVGGHGRS